MVNDTSFKVHICTYTHMETLYELAKQKEKTGVLTQFFQAQVHHKNPRTLLICYHIRHNSSVGASRSRVVEVDR